MLGDRWIVDRVPTERFPNYTRGNAGEVLADPVSPLGWTFGFESGVVPGCRDGFVLLGVFDVLRSDVVTGIADLAALVGPVTVGVLDDATAAIRRGRPPIVAADDRVAVVRALRGVTEARVA